MNLIEARTNLKATISRLEDLAKHDLIRSNPISRHAVARAIKDGRELLEAIKPGLINDGTIVTEAKCVEDLTTIASNLDSYADHLADCLAQHCASDANTAPVTGTTILTPDEFDALLGNMTSEEFVEFSELGTALYRAIRASNPQSKKEFEQLGYALLMAKRNDPNACAETLAEDAMLILGVTT